jgi:hypothetical protein
MYSCCSRAAFTRRASSTLLKASLTFQVIKRQCLATMFAGIRLQHAQRDLPAALLHTDKCGVSNCTLAEWWQICCQEQLKLLADCSNKCCSASCGTCHVADRAVRPHTPC